jgi:eukaryotic-like serine/threonine-protein kinase
MGGEFFMSDPHIGRLLNQRYQLQDLIGSGAMGKVYLAEDVLLGGVPVAVKFLALSLQHKQTQIQLRFEREAKTCALLGQKSMHIVRVMDYGVDQDSMPFYVMEYLLGKSLSEIIRASPLSVTRFLSLARQITLGLQCAHEGIPVDGKIYPIIHRDIKPSNILVIQDPSFGELAKVLDFGIAKLLESNANITNYYLGTLAYSSPEQMEGKELDCRSDFYSLGVMMFEMLTARMPVQPDTHSFGAWYKAHHEQIPRSFAAIDPRLHIPAELKTLVMSCLAKSKSDRPQTTREILQVITSLEQRASNQVPEDLFIEVPSQSRKTDWSTQEIIRSSAWPKNKPIADIVFAHPISVNSRSEAALWIMLPQQEIRQRSTCTRYNQFLFITTPHPMLLWITVIYNRKSEPKWLPYYLDLKNRQSQEITQLLAAYGSYRLLFFTREIPQPCIQVLVSTISLAQRTLLQQWVMVSQTLISAADPQKRVRKNQASDSDEISRN